MLKASRNCKASNFPSIPSSYSIVVLDGTALSNLVSIGIVIEKRSPVAQTANAKEMPKSTDV